MNDDLSGVNRLFLFSGFVMDYSVLPYPDPGSPPAGIYFTFFPTKASTAC